MPKIFAGCLGVFLLVLSSQAAEPVKGGARQLQLAARPAALELAPMPSFVEPPPSTNTYTLKWVTFNYSDSTNKQSVSVSWEKVASPEVTGYKVLYGTASRAYTTTNDAGAATSVVITNLDEGATYYFAIKAYSSGVEGDYSSEVSYTVATGDTKPGNISLTTGKPLVVSDVGVTNAVISVGTSPGRIDWIFDAGATNRFAVSNLLYGMDYFICMQTEQAGGAGLISSEFRFPLPEPPLEVYVRTTLQYLNVTTGLWEDRFSDVVTNPVGTQYRRIRIGGPTNSPAATTKAQQTAASPRGPWHDIPNTVSALSVKAEDHPKARFAIVTWNNQTNNTPYIFPEQ